MLVKNAINKAIKAGMVTDVRERMIEITNPRNGQKCSTIIVMNHKHTNQRWKVHGNEPDKPQFDIWNSTYVDNLTQALRMISTEDD